MIERRRRRLGRGVGHGLDRDRRTAAHRHIANHDLAALPPFDIAPFTWIPGPIWFFLKIAFVLFCFLWVRATFPRYRYDQLMRLGWKVFLPFSLIWVALTAGVLMAFDIVPNAAG